MISENKQLAATAAKRLYEKGLAASSVVRSLKKGGHALEDVAFAARQFPELDAMLFGETWGGDDIQQHAARHAFLFAGPERSAGRCPICAGTNCRRPNCGERS